MLGSGVLDGVKMVECVVVELEILVEPDNSG